MKNLRKILIFMFVSLLCTGLAYSQAVNATLVGTITDSSGALVVNAKVTVTNTGPRSGVCDCHAWRLSRRENEVSRCVQRHSGRLNAGRMSHGAAAGPSACRAVLARAISVIFLPRVRNHAAIGRLVRRSKPSARYQPRTLELPTNCKPVRPPGIRCASSLVIVLRVACATPCGAAGLGFADFDGVPDPGADEPPADDGPLFFGTGTPLGVSPNRSSSSVWAVPCCTAPTTWSRRLPQRRPSGWGDLRSVCSTRRRRGSA